MLRLLKENENCTFIGLDNMSAYYDVSIKEYRLQQIEEAVAHSSCSWHFVKGNIADAELIKKLFAEYRFQVVVNLAAQAGVRYSIENPDAYIEANVIGFYNILEHDSYGNWITDRVLGQRVSVMYTDDVRPVCWLGDNGLIGDCVFSSNGALNGGALTWMGNNGVINNTLFVNNTARGVGGAVYMGGMNNTIANTTFVNSSSLLSCEAIYFDRRHGDYILSNVDFNQDVWVIDGVYSGIDVDYLKYAYYSQVGDKWINLIPLLYQSIVNNNVSYFDSETYCIARNDNFNDTGYGSVFALSILTDFNRDSIVYQKDYLFINATFNSVFSSLLGGSFTNSFAVVKNVYVNDLGAYENLCKADVYGLVTNTESMNIIRQEFIWNAKNLLSPFTFCLNVSFAPGAVFNSNSAFDVGNYFNVINIAGNGARIQASTAKDDEYTWITNDYKSYSISNLVIDGFNHGIFNYGMCILDNVTFENNHIVFSFAKKDWGAAILNVGTCICYNCTFANNIANSGGAIYNQGRLTIENCSFYSNDVEPSFFNSIGITAGGVGVDICNLQGKGVVYAAQKIDYAEVTGFDVLEIAAVSAASVALSFVAGVGIGYAVGSVKVGAVVGGVDQYKIPKQKAFRLRKAFKLRKYSNPSRGYRDACADRFDNPG